MHIDHLHREISHAECWEFRYKNVSSAPNNLLKQLRRAIAFPTRLHVRPSAGAFIQSDQSLRCPPKDYLDPWLSTESHVKTLIKLHGCNFVVGNAVPRPN